MRFEAGYYIYSLQAEPLKWRALSRPHGRSLHIPTSSCLPFKTDVVPELPQARAKFADMCGEMQRTRIPSIEQLLRVSMSVNDVTLPTPSSTDLRSRPQVVRELVSPSTDIDLPQPTCGYWRR